MHALLRASFLRKCLLSAGQPGSQAGGTPSQGAAYMGQHGAPAGYGSYFSGQAGTQAGGASHQSEAACCLSSRHAGQTLEKVLASGREADIYTTSEGSISAGTAYTGQQGAPAGGVPYQGGGYAEYMGQTGKPAGGTSSERRLSCSQPGACVGVTAACIWDRPNPFPRHGWASQSGGLEGSMAAYSEAGALSRSCCDASVKTASKGAFKDTWLAAASYGAYVKQAYTVSAPGSSPRQTF